MRPAAIIFLTGFCLNLPGTEGNAYNNVNRLEDKLVSQINAVKSRREEEKQSVVIQPEAQEKKGFFSRVKDFIKNLQTTSPPAYPDPIPQGKGVLNWIKRKIGMETEEPGWRQSAKEVKAEQQGVIPAANNHEESKSKFAIAESINNKALQADKQQLKSEPLPNNNQRSRRVDLTINMEDPDNIATLSGSTFEAEYDTQANVTEGDYGRVEVPEQPYGELVAPAAETPYSGMPAKSENYDTVEPIYDKVYDIKADGYGFLPSTQEMAQNSSASHMEGDYGEIPGQPMNTAESSEIKGYGFIPSTQEMREYLSTSSHNEGNYGQIPGEEILNETSEQNDAKVNDVEIEFKAIPAAPERFENDEDDNDSDTLPIWDEQFDDRKTDQQIFKDDIALNPKVLQSQAIDKNSSTNNSSIAAGKNVMNEIRARLFSSQENNLADTKSNTNTMTNK